MCLIHGQTVRFRERRGHCRGKWGGVGGEPEQKERRIDSCPEKSQGEKGAEVVKEGICGFPWDGKKTLDALKNSRKVGMTGGSPDQG